MMLSIPYGQGEIKVDINVPYRILVPKKIEIKNQNKVIEYALKNPIKSTSFEKFVKKSNELLVIVNDATRPTPTAKILRFLYPQLSNHPNLKFIVACGSHRSPTKEEYKFIFGETYDKFKDKIFVHDARKKEDLRYIGRTKRGTEIYINKMVLDIKNFIVIGSVESHYFAGYTGGRKSFLPGVAGYKTIEKNHKLALSDNAQSLSLKGNPVHEDMTDVIGFFKDINIFSIQAVLNKENKIYAVKTGDILESFNAAVKFTKNVFSVPLKRKGDIVISVAPHPMDIDLYQSQKAIDNGKHALKKDGILILVSKCRMGVGKDTFLEPFSKKGTPEEVLDYIKEEYKLGYHKAAKMIEIKKWAELWAVTDLDEKIIKKARLKPFHSLQDAVDKAIERVSSETKKPRIIVMPFGSLTIPILKEN